VTKTGNQTARVVFLKNGSVQVSVVAVGQQSSLSGVIQPREFISSPVTGAPPGSQIIAAGADATCGLLPLGRGYCFGRAPLLGVAKDTSCFGDVGSTTTPCTLVPLRIAGQLNFVSVSVGESVACGATADGRAYCWGQQTFGQLGNGISSTGSSLTPALVIGAVGSNAFLLSRVTAGGFHACGLNASGSAFCWGQDSLAQLANGDGNRVNSTTPIPVAGGFTFSTISAGSKHTCGLRADGVVMCWGDNRRGQLGTFTPDTVSDTPVPVSGSYSQISAGRSHTCALTPAGAAVCWGGNDSSQLGRGAPESSTVPVPVAGGLTFRSITAGAFNTCGITTGGAAYCWGSNEWGQLGNGARSQLANTPVAVGGGRSDFVAVAAGIRHTCAVATSGVYCWGSNIFGALGNEFQAVVQLTPTKTATPQ
jgi:alpha-tubulin suppressor-like RCC1 family protein